MRRAGYSGLCAAALTSGANALWRRAPLPLQARLERTNFAGRTVSLREGPAVVAGLVGGLLVAGEPAMALSTATTGLLGLADDLVGTGDSKGLRGHLAALGRGDLTTGSIKLIGIGTLAALVAARHRDPRMFGVDTVLVAAGTNLINLFDLRPGRALKVSLLAATGLVCCGRHAAGAVLGAGSASVPADLAGRTMLGDTGANALGFALAATCLELSPRTRVVLATAGVGLTLLSEKVSFSAVIQANPLLRAIDEAGRR